MGTSLKCDEDDSLLFECAERALDGGLVKPSVTSHSSVARPREPVAEIIGVYVYVTDENGVNGVPCRPKEVAAGTDGSDLLPSPF